MEVDTANKEPVKTEQNLVEIVLQDAIEMDAANLNDLVFKEDPQEKSGRDKYVLTFLDENISAPPLFFVEGEIEVLSITPGSAIHSRKTGYRTRLDEYSISITVDEADATRSAFDVLLQKLKETPDALPKISCGSGLVEKKEDFEKYEDDIKIKVSGVSGSVVYFNRKVARRGAEAGKEKVEGLPDCFQQVPKQGASFPKLEYPSFMSLVPLIPCIDSTFLPLDVSAVTTPRRGKVFFEVVQGCYNFRSGGQEHVRQISLIPSVVAVMLEPEAALASRMNSPARISKRRRLCF